jgi:hypothetical protein
LFFVLSQTSTSYRFISSDMQNLVPSTGDRQLQFSIDADAFRHATSFRVKRGLAVGWSNLIFNGFHDVWPHCSLTMKRNYLSSHTRMTTTPYWTANAACRTHQCNTIRFIVQDEPHTDATTVSVKAHITGVCQDAEPVEVSMIHSPQRITGENN